MRLEKWGTKKNISLKILKNINKFCEARKDIIDLIDDFTALTPEAWYKAIKETKGKGRPLDVTTWIKILASKQMLQRLPISLEQVIAGNTSEHLLSRI